ncbi:hypothetical protein BDR07DRAFT_1380571 [Suillus spraguei]|nr:hypothetical protein BDR07DRAFT_1380571 [Suillus spraguei]
MASPDKGNQKENPLILNKKVKTFKETNNLDANQVSEEFLIAAHAMARCVDLFCNVEKLLRVGFLLQQEQAMENGELDKPEPEHESCKKRLATLLHSDSLFSSSTNTLNRYKHNYQQLLHLDPGLCLLIADHPQIAQKINTVISGTHSDNLWRSPKPDYPQWWLAVKGAYGHKPPGAGFIPLSDIWACQFQEGSCIWMKIRQICMTSTNFPVFLWARNPPGSNYNEDAMHEGLFHGYFLECAQFGISNKNKWAEADGKFNNGTFYYNITDFLCKALFKNENGHKGGMTITDDNGPAGSSLAPINSLAKIAAKGPAVSVPTLPTNPTPPQSPVTPDPEPLMPPIATLRPLQTGSIQAKSPAPSKLTPDEVLSDHNDELLDPEDVSTKRKKKASKTKWAAGRTAKHHVVTEESDDGSEDKELAVAKPTKSQGKCVTHRK